MNLLLLTEGDFTAPGKVRLTDRRHEQLYKILKAQPGKVCKAGIFNGKVGSAAVEEICREYSVLSVQTENPPPPPSDVILTAALPRPQTFDKVIRCGVEMGVKEFHFFMSRKVEKSYWQSPVLEKSHIDHEIMLGLEQCGDTIPPRVHFHRLFKPFVEDELPEIICGGAAYVGHPAAPAPLPTAVPGKVTLIIGPEGGFTDYEVELLAANGVTPVTLGSRTLRTEHAVPALLAILKPPSLR